MIFRFRHDAPRSELRHINNKPQLILLIIGLVGLFAMGLGIFIIVYFEFNPTYKIKNDNTKEIFLYHENRGKKSETSQKNYRGYVHDTF